MIRYPEEPDLLWFSFHENFDQDQKVFGRTEFAMRSLQSWWIKLLSFLVIVAVVNNEGHGMPLPGM